MPAIHVFAKTVQLMDVLEGLGPPPSEQSPRPDRLPGTTSATISLDSESSTTTSSEAAGFP